MQWLNQILWNCAFLRFISAEIVKFYFYRDTNYDNVLPSEISALLIPDCSLSECVQECTREPKCLSVVYGNSTCYGYSNRIHAAYQTTTQSNFVYFESQGYYGNLAKNKPASQLSTYSKPSAGTFTADKAVDGIRDPRPDLLYNSCARVDLGVATWWKVDLLQPYTVTAVAILARTVAHEDSESLVIDVGEPFANCGSRGVGRGWTQSFRTFTCPVPLYGSIVKITKSVDQQYMCLCEVEVYGIN